MYLKNLKLQNFRSFDAGEIEFQKDLTVFVGENNGGKSNAIDALRLITSPLSGRREIYCEATDVRFLSGITHFDLEARFTELTTGQQGRFISAATGTSLEEVCFGLHFDGGATGSRPLIWAGKEGNSPEPGCYETVRHVYLPPLRDAKRSLASGNPTRIMALLRHFLAGGPDADLAKALARTTSHDVLTKVDDAVDKGLSALTSGVRRQSASVGFAANETLTDIARDLRFKLADHGVYPEDLRYSGHGYANLLFMAIIAVELESVHNADLTLFLVEEPEAHLHPQLQAAVLAFLQDQAEQSRKEKPSNHGPAGELQVVVATHSPNLSAWVSSDKLVVFKSIVPTVEEDSKDEPLIEPSFADAAVIESGFASDEGSAEEDGAKALATTMTAAAIRRSTRCIPVCRMMLEAIARRKVDRYLDVTKAALLFGGRILLVEGIAEALLLPVIAKCHTFKDHPDKLRLFRSSVFVPIDGVDFAPYITLLLTTVNEVRIADRVVVLTDGDKGTADIENDEIDEDPVDTDDSEHEGPSMIPGVRRKNALENLAAQLGASGEFAVLTSTYSLETELLEAGNSAVMERAFTDLHPRSKRKWETAVALEGDDRAKRIHEIFKKTKKGDFAQTLARLIEDGAEFVVPTYITAAIEAVVS